MSGAFRGARTRLDAAVDGNGIGGDRQPHSLGSWRETLGGWQFWLGLVVSAFFLYWAIRQAGDLGNVARSLAQANYLYVIPALGAYFIGVAIRAGRWQILLSPVRRLGLRQLFVLVVIGYMANDVLPARMGELVRAYVLNRDEGVGKTTCLATIFVERVFDGLTMLLFIAVVALFVPLGQGLENVVRITAVLMLGLLGGALLAAASRTRALQLVSLGLRLAPARAQPKLAYLADQFLSGLAALQSVRAVAWVLGLSIVAWLFEAVMYAVIGLGFGLVPGFHAFALTTAVVNLGTMVPSSPGYVGTFEALAVATLGIFGIDGDRALSYTFALHAVLLVPVTLLGFFYMWRRHISLGQARRGQ